MARVVVVQTRTELDDADRDLIREYMGPLIQAECALAQRAIDQGLWNNLNIGLADAGDWGLILADIMRKDLTTLEDIQARVGRLDTAARDAWYHVLDRIQKSATL
jgi:hypothetical protein